ncbi:hypothetical protein [Actomonas aquatica]|uniref:Uncharacterized protein n=1 Tax=Actomonas aquatica TaxID=2866162 RepID=A0ABZ1CEJ7_9BACT|nr:hypothetical protein [Opitutus sp. WL0086]WRQ89974.1 hypothetical protein K1X11_011195 [Opitutus sp. WL0086]
MTSWLPWRFLISRIARRRGFLDPVTVLARLRQFSQPSEVQEPIELIRAGVAFHARGLVNTKVLQNNLDWVWPYWASRQFDPTDPAFLPRAFSFTHVNLTHRNWTALGLPGMDAYPIVDPRGLVTPLLDGWSIDWWFLPRAHDEDVPALFPSRCREADQQLHLEPELEVRTTTADATGTQLVTRARVRPSALNSRVPELVLDAALTAAHDGYLACAIRPANPEGVSFIDELKLVEDTLHVNGTEALQWSQPPRWVTSNYERGDIAGIAHHEGIPERTPPTVSCPAGLATGAALFPVQAGTPISIEARMPLPETELKRQPTTPELTWSEALAAAPRIKSPDTHWNFLHDAALHTLHLLSPHDIYPGPYTYRRFWFRDACLILNALLAANEIDRARALLETFPERQKSDGYFHSQEGEWDANGQVLWIADRVEQAGGHLLPQKLWRDLARGADWFRLKRLHADGKPHDGLLPPGFSAEHLGPNDYYYWDDLWALAGLRAAAQMATRRGETQAAQTWTNEADNLAHALQRSFAKIPADVTRHGVPASPYRRMDSGAIGTMVGDYPLQLDELGPEHFTRTADWLSEHCLHRDGFFQDMIHSGVNAYLTLDLAQTLLRHDDPRYLRLVQAVADAASPTGQWPEAIHPHTGGGCMGDGQHAWAAAEWMLMMRALFVREERDHLVIGAGLPAAWFDQRETNELHYGPTATKWGPVTVSLQRSESGSTWRVKVTGDWHGEAPRMEVTIPCFQTFALAKEQNPVALERA